MIQKRLNVIDNLTDPKTDILSHYRRKLRDLCITDFAKICQSKNYNEFACILCIQTYHNTETISRWIRETESNSEDGVTRTQLENIYHKSNIVERVKVNMRNNSKKQEMRQIRHVTMKKQQDLPKGRTKAHSMHES